MEKFFCKLLSKKNTASINNNLHNKNYTFTCISPVIGWEADFAVSVGCQIKNKQIFKVNFFNRWGLYCCIATIFFKKLCPVVTVKTNGYVFQQHLKSSPAILISFYAGTEPNNFDTKFIVLLRLVCKLLFSIPPEVSSCLTLFHVICISITFLEE